MPQRRGLSGAPVSFITDGEWPDGETTEVAVRAVQEFCRNLRAAMGDASVRTVAGKAKIAHQTIYDLREGRTWPDFVSVLRLEIALEVPLWPVEHRRVADPDPVLED